MSAETIVNSVDDVWSETFDRTCDVAVVGSGAAGIAAAIAAALAGAKVTLIEAARSAGGTTAKSGGAFWVPGNCLMRAEKTEDDLESALEYAARLARSERFDATDRHLGLSKAEYAVLRRFVDSCSDVVDALVGVGALYLDTEARASTLDMYPDYHEHLHRGAPIRGRMLFAAPPPGETVGTYTGDESAVGGAVMVKSMLAVASDLGVELRLDNRVQDVVRNVENAVVGVVVKGRRDAHVIGARRGVVFASGGFLMNEHLVRNHLRGPIFGGCAAASSNGDFVGIASKLGVRLGNMNNAWWDQVVLEMALRSQSTLKDIWVPFGDSMVQVNKYGNRVGNEKAIYNERGQVHFAWDPVELEYPNLLLFQIYDDAVALDARPNRYRGWTPLPGESADYVVSADTIADLTTSVDQRLETLSAQTGGVRLDSGFVNNLETTLKRFSAMALRGVDMDYNRGATHRERAWSGDARGGALNPCMAPFAENGRYHCIIVAAGALDTKGGPVIDPNGRVLGCDGVPIAGLFGAGNCIASPLLAGYPGPGATIAVAITFGFLAGRAAASGVANSPSGLH